MTRPPPLQPHLLTRSDLAQMAVPAGEVLSWLTSGALEQVGLLPNELAADPVFTVLTPELCVDLTARLAAIGKTTVVLTPPRVRSFLMRAIAAPDGGTAEEHAETDLAHVLQQAATEVSGELEQLLELAAEEAHFEALELAAALGNEAPAFDDGEGDGAPSFDDLDTCFDLADLEAAVGGDSAPAAAEPTPAEAEPAAEPEAASLAEPAPSEPSPASRLEMPQEEADGLAGVTTTRAAESLPAAHVAVHASPHPTESVRSVAPREEPAVTTGAAAPVPSEVPSEDSGVAPLPIPAAGTTDAVAPASEPATIERVETLLGLLKDAVVELAQRPEPPRVDMRPFVVAMQASLDRSAEQSAATASVLQSLDARVDSLGERIEQVTQRQPGSLATPHSGRGAGGRAPAPTAAPASTVPLAMAGLAVLAVAWSILFWMELEAPRLAAGTLVGANVAGCLLLSSWWRRG